MELFDSHAHYNDEKFDQDRNQVIKQIYENGVTKLICAGYSLPSSKKALEIANKYDFIYATAGISPNDIPGLEGQTISRQEFQKQLGKKLEQLQELATSKKVVAIGEIGLDYHWNTENKEEQKLAFIKQIELANSLNLPIVIHTRDAVYDTIEILKNQITANKKGVFHCCPLNLDLIREGLKLGFYISFAGPITFKNSKNAGQAINLVPLNKMLIETDSPYLAPEPNRGTRNNSSNVKYVAEKIAEVKEMPIEQIAKATYQNAERIFLLK